MVRVNHSQLQALRVLIQKVDLEQVTVEPFDNEGILLHLEDQNGEEKRLVLDKWGIGKLLEGV